MFFKSCYSPLKFLLTRLMRGAAIAAAVCNGNYKHFYSRASCEARRDSQTDKLACSFHFYSRASCEARLGGLICRM